MIVEKVMAETAEQQLARQEGRKKMVYHDTKGFHTIGIGHNLDARGVDDATIMRWFEEDYHTAQFDLVTHLPWVIELDPIRRDVLVNMTFNMGITRLLKFKKMLAAAEAHDWITAKKEMLNSDWAKPAPLGVGDRAKELAENMLTGVRK